MVELTNEQTEKVYEAIELARKSGKIKKGTNEVTKAIERRTAKLVAVAKDVSPAEIIMHMPLLSKENNVLCVEVPTKTELGAAAGIDIATGSVAIIEEGEGKDIVKKLQEELQPSGE